MDTATALVTLCVLGIGMCLGWWGRGKIEDMMIEWEIMEDEDECFFEEYDCSPDEDECSPSKDTWEDYIRYEEEQKDIERDSTD